MNRYYTRASNFYYGDNARLLIRRKLALPLCVNKNIAFGYINAEIDLKNPNIGNFEIEVAKNKYKALIINEPLHDPSNINLKN